MTSVALAADAIQAADAVADPRRIELDVPRIFVVPAFNEEENLPRLFADFEARPWLLEPPGSRLIVVDDGSDDLTPALVRAYGGPLPVELVRLEQNGGPGAAFRRGFAEALDGAPPDALVVTLEADTTSDLDALPAMLELACYGADVVLASVHGGGTMHNVGLLRRVLSRSVGCFVRIALGIDARTVSCFFRVYRASILRAAVARYGESLIREAGFACKAELLAKLAALGAGIEEVPVDLDASRRIGDSKMSVLGTLLGYARLLSRGRPTRASAT
jgi:dolichol-phosphate mannosyltransferase